jgi:hypothetical protein
MGYFYGIHAVEIGKMRIKRAERKAAENWRFRHLKSKESKVLAAVLTNVRGFFRRAFSLARRKSDTGSARERLSFCWLVCPDLDS